MFLLDRSLAADWNLMIPLLTWVIMISTGWILRCTIKTSWGDRKDGFYTLHGRKISRFHWFLLLAPLNARGGRPVSQWVTTVMVHTPREKVHRRCLERGNDKSADTDLSFGSAVNRSASRYRGLDINLSLSNWASNEARRPARILIGPLPHQSRADGFGNIRYRWFRVRSVT